MIDTQDQALVAAFESTRARTLGLVETLSAEDACVQSMPQASPTKWHLAHTTWFFETFVLEPYEKDFRPFAPAFRVLFNTYYQGIGAQHPRGQRGLLTRPSLQEVLRYRSDVDNRVIALLNGGRLDARVVTLLTLGLQHEQQHQELILTDLLHLFSCNPLAPAYLNTAPAPKGHVVDRSIREEATTWHALAGGLVQIGHDGIGFCFDNELPQHPTYVAPCDVATHLVTNGQYLRFVQDGGYTEPHHWLAEG